MHPVPFDYLAASSVAEACAAKSEDPSGAMFLAGGQSLMPRLARREDRPRRLIDITRITDLRHLHVTGHGLHVGAAVTQRTAELMPDLAGFGVLSQALPRVGKLTTRNRGTVCGSLAHANPAAELGVCLLALGGEVTAVSATGSRRITAEDFFRSPYTTALRADELLHTVTFTRPVAGSVGYFDEVTLRGAGDQPLLSAAVTAQVSECEANRVRIAIGGTGQRPVLASPAIIGALDGRLGDDAVDHVSHVFAADLEFLGDAAASAEHRRRLAVHLIARLLRRVKKDLP